MALFFIVFLIIYGLINFYIGLNGWFWLKRTPFSKYKKTYLLLVIFLSSSYIIGRFTDLNYLTIIGGYWLAIFLYSMILLPLANIVTFLLMKRGIFWIGIITLASYSVILLYGSYNAWTPVVREYSIEIEKEAEELSELTILMAADFHLGDIVRGKHLQRFVEIAQSTEPDIILLPGDLIDDYIEPYIEKNMGEVMRQIKAPLGVYAVMGNHEYYGDQLTEIYETLQEDGINILMDESVLIKDSLYIFGRKDQTDRHRKSIDELLTNIDSSKPIIMLDHQPTEISVAENHEVDILLSGHTHHGQMYPGQLITGRLFENDWGHLQKGDFHSFVTSGFGTWGPPLRIGTRSEVMIIHVKFNSNFSEEE